MDGYGNIASVAPRARVRVNTESNSRGINVEVTAEFSWDVTLGADGEVATTEADKMIEEVTRQAAVLAKTQYRMALKIKEEGNA